MEKMPGRLCGSSIERKARKLPGFYLGVVCGWILMLMPCASAVETMFFNSLANCGHGDTKDLWHRVDPESLYNIRDDVSPHTRTSTFMQNCEMVFRSISSDGRLCMLQRTLAFSGPKVELKLYDGHAGVNGKIEPDKVVNMDDDLVKLEWCTTGRFLTLELAQRADSASVKDVDIDLLVYQMDSIHRKVYMDTSPSCGSVLEMEHSKVNVTNINPSLPNMDIFSKCMLDFEYRGHEENRSLCMVFEPSPYYNLKCHFNYSLQVAEFVPLAADAGGGVQRIVRHKGGCGRPLPPRWCTNSSRISLLLERPDMGPEKGVLFYILVLDHKGDPETLPSVFVHTDDTPSATLTVTIIAIVVSLSILFLIIVFIFIILCRRRRSKAPEEKKTKKLEEKKANGDASHQRMLDIGGEQRSNGQNHYTTGSATAEFV